MMIDFDPFWRDLAARAVAAFEQWVDVQGRRLAFEERRSDAIRAETQVNAAPDDGRNGVRSD